MRRIVVNGRFLAQPRTGVQRYALETLRALDTLLGKQPQTLCGTRWQLAVPSAATDIPLLEHFEIQTLQFFAGHAWEQVSLATFARGAYLINMNYSAPLFKRDQLITLHDASVRAHPQTYSPGYRLLNNLMVSWLAPRVDTVMTVSQFSAQQLKALYRIERDIVVGCLGWEHTSAPRGHDEGDAASVLQRYGLASGGYLLAVGSPKPNKNFALIARALRLLGDELPMPVAVAGALDAKVFQQAEPVAVNAMRWLGFVPDADLNVLYRHASWFVFPSLYEGFGLPPLEAMANGCPVLAAQAASIPEVYGDAVLYFDPHDAVSLAARLHEVTTCADAPALRATLLQRAAARLALYRWDANARIVLDRLVERGAMTPLPDSTPNSEPGFEPATPMAER
jgi:glycosyltransferase involved in cell wall biosynthesis